MQNPWFQVESQIWYDLLSIGVWLGCFVPSVDGRNPYLKWLMPPINKNQRYDLSTTGVLSSMLCVEGICGRSFRDVHDWPPVTSQLPGSRRFVPHDFVSSVFLFCLNPNY